MKRAHPVVPDARLIGTVAHLGGLGAPYPKRRDPSDTRLVDAPSDEELFDTPVLRNDSFRLEFKAIEGGTANQSVRRRSWRRHWPPIGSASGALRSSGIRIDPLPHQG